MQTKTIHQFSPAVTINDGVSNALFFTQRILHELGFKSYIYAAQIDKKLKDKVFNINDYHPSPQQVLLYHHSIGHIDHEKIMNFSDKKIMVYHNITPSHFFQTDKHLNFACKWGREQLANSKEYFIGSYADSYYNVEELKLYGYKFPRSIPVLSDFENRYQPNIKGYDSTYNILFVGRIVSNKSQHQLVEVIYYLKEKMGIEDIKLFLVGAVSQPGYNDFLIRYIENLDLKEQVVLTGKVDDKELALHYAKADIYLSLSEHEGFGIPLIEAMKYDIPVLAYEAGAVGQTIGKKGLLRFKSPDTVAQNILEVMNSSSKRTELLLYQRERLKNFEYNNIKKKLSDYLSFLGISTPPIQDKKIVSKQRLNVRIEGPFDSSYSLAIVNNNLSKALKAEDLSVELYSTEGYGDFEPDLNSIDEENKLLFQNKLQKIDITIRNLYPPRTNAMRGYHKIIGPYGWEESAFSQRFVNDFNKRLSMLFCMSSFVKKIMIRNGVKIPLYATGIGVDHVLSHPVEKIPYKLPKDFKLLHISSCFPRKGVDILLDVFKEIAHLDISLIIKTFPNPHNDIKEQIAKLPKKIQNKILLINEELTPSQINYLYQNCDVLVAPSRGEGFGLPMAEAMLFDLPVITTAYGGQRDFCHQDNSWLIDYSFKKAKTHFKLFDSYWAEPSKESLKEKILELYSMPKEQIEKKTKKAKNLILSDYKWSDIAKRIKKTIKEYKPKPLKKLKLAWISTYNSKCGIASYSNSLIKNIIDKIDSITIYANRLNPSDILSQKEEKNVIRVWRDRFEKDDTELISKIKKQNPTHIVIEFNFAFFSMQNLKNLIENNLDKSIILELHSVEDVTIKGLEASLGDISNTLKKVDMIMVHNISDLNVLKSFGIVENVMLFPLGVESFKPLQKDISYTIATFGFLLPHKGTMEIIEAFAYIKKNIKDANLLLLNSLYPSVISQDYFSKCQKKIKELDLQDSVTFITDYLSKEQIHDYLSRAKLLVLPYKDTQESASASVRDMIATERPILATAQNIFNDVLDIIHITQFNDPKELADDIMKLLNNEEKLYSKSHIQKIWIKEHSFKLLSQKFINILEETSK